MFLYMKVVFWFSRIIEVKYNRIVSAIQNKLTPNWQVESV